MKRIIIALFTLISIASAQEVTFQIPAPIPHGADVTILVSARQNIAGAQLEFRVVPFIGSSTIFLQRRNLAAGGDSNQVMSLNDATGSIRIKLTASQTRTVMLEALYYGELWMTKNGSTTRVAKGAIPMSFSTMIAAAPIDTTGTTNRPELTHIETDVRWALNTAMSFYPRDSVRLVFSDSLDANPRPARDPRVDTLKYGLGHDHQYLLLVDTTGLHAQLFIVIKNQLGDRADADSLKYVAEIALGPHDSTTINGVKGNSFILITPAALKDTLDKYTRRALDSLYTVNQRTAQSVTGPKTWLARSTFKLFREYDDTTMVFGGINGNNLLLKLRLNSGLVAGAYQYNLGFGTIPTPALQFGYNTWFGIGVGREAMTGTSNTFAGYRVGENSTTARDNTYSGAMTGAGGTSASFSTGTGSGVLSVNKTSQQHTASGYLSLTNKWTGTGVTATGTYSGQFDVRSSYSVYLGHSAGPTLADTANVYNCALCLGANSRPSASNQLQLGGAGAAITEGYIGNGTTNVSPANITLRATGASGSATGAKFTIQAGTSATGAGGVIEFKTGASGENVISIDALGGWNGNGRTRGLATIGAGDSVQVTLAGVSFNDFFTLSYRAPLTARSGAHTELSWDVVVADKLTIYGTAGMFIRWMRQK